MEPLQLRIRRDMMSLRVKVGGLGGPKGTMISINPNGEITVRVRTDDGEVSRAFRLIELVSARKGYLAHEIDLPSELPAMNVSEQEKLLISLDKGLAS